MSLPSTAIFELHNGDLVEAFCNIGWVYDERYIPRTVADAMQYAKLNQDEWKTVTLYEHTYTKKQLNNIMKYYHVMSYEEWKKEHYPDFTEGERKELAIDFLITEEALSDIIENACKKDYEIYRDNRYKEIRKSDLLYP